MRFFKSATQEGDVQHKAVLYLDQAVPGVLIGKQIKLYDDDDRFLNQDSVWGSNLTLSSPPLPADNRSGDFVAAMAPSFERGYIKLVNANAMPGWNPTSQRLVPFKRNAGFGATSSAFEGNLNLRGTDRPAFWAYSVVFGYQPSRLEDGDPDREEVSLGANADDWPTTTLDGFCVVYLESIRDKVWGINRRDATTLASDFLAPGAAGLRDKYLDRLYGAIIHEIGHAPPQVPPYSLDPFMTDHSELGLMVEGASTFPDTFRPRTILRFRAATKWAP